MPAQDSGESMNIQIFLRHEYPPDRAQIIAYQLSLLQYFSAISRMLEKPSLMTKIIRVLIYNWDFPQGLDKRKQHKAENRVECVLSVFIIMEFTLNYKLKIEK